MQNAYFPHSLTKLACLLATTMLLQIPAFGQCRLNKSGWQLDPSMSEDFNPGTTLSTLSANWILEDGGFGDGTSAYEAYTTPNNITIANGYGYFNTVYSDIPLFHANNIDYYYSVGSIKSRHDDFPGSPNPGGALYGMYEIRCKLPGREGQSPCFWLNGHSSWPPELDVFEYNGSHPNSFFNNIHYKNPAYASNPGASKNLSCGDTYRFPINLSDDFHTWTLVWTPTKVTFFFDGKELRTIDIAEYIPGAPAWGSNSNPEELVKWLKMDIMTGSGLNSPGSNTTFDPFIIDYIHVYRPASLPAYIPNPGQYPHNYSTYIPNQLWPAYQNLEYKTVGSYWNLHAIDTQDPYHVVGNMQVVQDGKKFYYRGDFNLLWNTYEYNYGSGYQYYSAPIQWNWNETVDGDIAVNSTQSIVAFTHNNGLHYYENGVFTDASFVASGVNPKEIKVSEDGLVITYIIGNRIGQAYRTTPTSGWITRSTRQNVSPINLALHPTDNTKAYFIDATNQLCLLDFSTFRPSIVVLNQNDAAGNLTVTPSGKVYYRTTSNGIAYCEFDSNLGIWQRQEIIAQYPWTSGPVPLFTVGDGIQIREIGANIIFFLDTSRHVWNVYKYNGTWYTNTIDDAMNYASGNLVLDKQTNERLCFVATDGIIRTFTWEACERLNPTCNAPTTLMRTANTTSTNANPASNQNHTVVASAGVSGTAKVYPNPVEHLLTIENPSVTGATEVIIYTTKMQQVQATTVYETNSTINVGNLPAGLYYLQLKSNTTNELLKFIKQ